MTELACSALEKQNERVLASIASLCDEASGAERGGKRKAMTYNLNKGKHAFRFIELAWRGSSSLLVRPNIVRGLHESLEAAM